MADGHNQRLARDEDSTLLAFYRGDAPDWNGRTLEEIWSWTDDWLEEVHDYIQWLFPLPEPSGANASAPLLSTEEIAAFDSDDSLRSALVQSLELMLQFYGLKTAARGPDVGVVRGGDFDERSRLWLTKGNHNFLRISRMLRSLSLLGLGPHAVALLECLEGIYTENPTTIGSTTIGYWRRAIAP